MKLIKLSVLLALALAMTFGATGCKKKQQGVTRLPGSHVGTPDVNDSITDTQPPWTAPDGPTGENPEMRQDPSWTVGQMDQDRIALAAYTVYFAFDSSSVRAGEQTKLEATATALKSDAAAKLLIEGHCDERGTEEYNRSLGERRALALREELAKLGVDPSRIKTTTFGEDKPAVQGQDESAWSKNRRGEFVLLHPKM